jgi:hypothetical protein
MCLIDIIFLSQAGGIAFLHAVFQSTWLSTALNNSIGRCELSKLGHHRDFCVSWMDFGSDLHLSII